MSPTLRLAAILGLLSAVGPVAIDMYLPAMPQIAAALGTDVAGTQATLVAFFAAFGIGQLAYGPWSDAAGRRPPLVAGLALYVAASVGAALAPDIATLTVARAAQGLGAAVVMVVPRAVIRDHATGPDGTRLMALVMLVISVSPMLAPLLGSVVILFADWRAIFWAMAVAGVASVLVTILLLPETLPVAARRPVAPGRLVADAARLLRHGEFMLLTFVGAFGMASFFVFIASASFVYAGQFGLGPTAFSLAFAVNAAAFFAATQLAAPLGARRGMAAVVRSGTAGFAGCAALLLALDVAGLSGLGVLIGLLAAGNFCLGLVIPSVMVLALDDQGETAGLAASLGGTLQMLTGAAVIVAAGPFLDGTATPMLAAIAACGAACALLARLATSRRAVPTV